MQRELADLKDEVTALRQITDGGAGATALALAPPRPSQQVWPHPSTLLGHSILHRRLCHAHRNLENTHD